VAVDAGDADSVRSNPPSVVCAPADVDRTIRSIAERLQTHHNSPAAGGRGNASPHEAVHRELARR
jgi:hypothetical protein